MPIYFQKYRVIGLHFCRCMYGSIFIQFCAVASKRRIFSAPECVLAVQGRSGSSKVDNFGTNRKRVYDFLLVINSNINSPILHRFWDTATFWLKIAYFSYPSVIRRPRSLPMLPFAEVNRQETRVMGLQWRPHDRSWSRFGMITACDRRSDGRTESIIANTACIASYADAL